MSKPYSCIWAFTLPSLERLATLEVGFRLGAHKIKPEEGMALCRAAAFLYQFADYCEEADAYSLDTDDGIRRLYAIASRIHAGGEPSDEPNQM